MNLAAISYEVRRTTAWSRAADYLELTKPRIALLVLLTVAVAALSAGAFNPVTVTNALLGTALVAASASALNQWLERRSDSLMPRTADRPLPAGRLSSGEVFAFGLITALAGLIYLAATVNLLAAGLGLLTWFLYVWVYTPLKSLSVSNTPVGAVAGALPALIGWAAAEGSLTLELGGSGLRALTLFVIVFLWQFPHFMAIAWIYRRQYAAAGLQMLPAVDPSGRRAGTQAVVSALLLLPVALVPALEHGGGVYIVGTLVQGLAYLIWSLAFCFGPSDATARRLLLASLVYLPVQLALFVLTL